MARSLRRAVEHGWCHVFGRGLERRAIFADYGDRRHRMDLCETLHDRDPFYIHAYALMDNHAILQTPDVNLSQLGEIVGSEYAAVSAATRHLENRSVSAPVCSSYRPHS